MKSTWPILESPRTLLDLHEGHRKSVIISVIGPDDVGGFVKIVIGVDELFPDADPGDMF